MKAWKGRLHYWGKQDWWMEVVVVEGFGELEGS